MQPGPKPRATILRLIAADQHRERLRADAPADPKSRPELPPGVKLSQPERAAWDWLLANVFREHVHGVEDSPLFVSCARLMVRAATADERLNDGGIIMRNPKTNQPLPNPYLRISTIAHNQLRLLLSELGGSPTARYRHAPPSSDGRVSEWDTIG